MPKNGSVNHRSDISSSQVILRPTDLMKHCLSSLQHQRQTSSHCPRWAKTSFCTPGSTVTPKVDLNLWHAALAGLQCVC